MYDLKSVKDKNFAGPLSFNFLFWEQQGGCPGEKRGMRLRKRKRKEIIHYAYIRRA
jgi:hypothetical protein